MAAGGRVWRVVAIGAALGAATMALWPQRPGPDGRLDLGDLLFINPAVRQRPHFHGLDYPLVMIVGAGVEVSRRVWLPPGKYAVEAAASAPAALVIDSRVVEKGGALPAEVTLAGYVHRVALSSSGGGVLQALALRRRGP